MKPNRKGTTRHASGSRTRNRNASNERPVQIDELTGLPADFAPLLGECYETADVERVVAGSSVARPVTLRANTLKADAGSVAESLAAAGIAFERASWYGDAFVLQGASERDVWDLPCYRDGEVYLQSLSSMLPALVLDAQAGEDVLDMCAAPGGKTSQIAALAQGRAHVTACEMHAPRAEKLAYNLDKLGVTGATVMRTDARQLDDFFSFDRILVDAPCSGSGTLRAHDPKGARHFSRELVEKSRKSQRALLAKALRLLKAGGTLVYSTCSVLRCENEDIVAEALAQASRAGTFEVADCSVDGLDAPFLPPTLEGTLTVCPSDLFEGFFIAKIRRTA